MYVLYTPASDDAYPTGMYLKDSVTGEDWYETLKKYDNEDIKIGYDKDGFVRWVFTDPTMAFPVDCDIAVIENPPENLTDHPYIYKDGKLEEDRSSLIANAKSLLEQEMNWSTSQLGALQDLAEDVELTYQQLGYVKDLKKYRVSLLDINPEDAPAITWPKRPVLAKR